MNQARGVSDPQFADGIADKVGLELHDAGIPFDKVYENNNINLYTNGMLTIDTLPCYIGGSKYIVIKHRNSIETWSSSPVDFNVPGPITYDFTTAASQAYGNNQTLIGLFYAIWAGDVTQDGVVDGSDMAAVNNISTSGFNMGYYNEDANGDGIVDGSDMAIIDNNATPPFVQVRKP